MTIVTILDKLIRRMERMTEGLKQFRIFWRKPRYHRIDLVPFEAAIVTFCLIALLFMILFYGLPTLNLWLT